jgi:aminobenzoyl-glutamate utilization protein B
MLRSLCRTAAAVAFASPLAAQGSAPAKTAVLRTIDAQHAHFADVARQIWSFAEVGFKETRSSALLQAELRGAGFAVEAGVAGMPTAFVASFGRGKPVIALFAEFDALPGLSQDAVPVRKSVGGDAGHGCGHHLLGTASVDAAIALKDWLARSGRSGTIRLYGTPAEEGGSGKVYLVRDGFFDDVDAVVGWHPGDDNSATSTPSLANISGKFRFRGVSAHAAASPEKGRSALDGVEAMDHMVNMLREHVPQETRIHYVITNGGRAPNVVPDFAEVYYYVRSPDTRVLQDVWDRVVKASQGAALGTGTTVDHEITGGVYSLLPNETLGRVMDANLRALGGIRYTPEERAFAEEIRKTLDAPAARLGSEAEVQPYLANAPPMSGSTDVGDISWVVPTAQISTATWVPGTPAHSWQATAAGGTTIGARAATLAAKAMAATVIDLFLDPALIARAKAELEQRRGASFRYKPLLGDRKPALDYRG